MGLGGEKSRLPDFQLSQLNQHPMRKKIYIELEAELLDNPDESVNVLSFSFLAFNPRYSQIIIWARFSCLMISFCATCVFANALRKLYFEDWNIEQKWTAVLSLSLLFLNNPTFPLQFLVRCWWISYADQLRPGSKY